MKIANFVLALSLLLSSLTQAASINTPADIQAQVSSGQVKLTWSYPADQRVGFVVVRIDLGSKEDNARQEFSGIVAKVRSYVDETVNPESSYLYMIKAVDGKGNESETTPPLLVKTAPAQGQHHNDPPLVEEDEDQAEVQDPQPNEPELISPDGNPASPAPMFQSYSPLTGIKVTGPISDLMNSTRNIPIGETQPSIQGTVSFADGSVYKDVTISLRGNSSKRMDQCSFAKLNVKLAARATSGILNGLKGFKIGTHCGNTDVPGPTWGRVLNEKSPVREALLYRILNLAGATTFRSRSAQVTYVDTSSSTDPKFFPDGGKSLTRKALVMEDEKDAARRSGHVIKIKSGDAAPAELNLQGMPDVDSESAVTGMLSEALAQNHDWYILDADGSGSLWNINFLYRKSDDSWAVQVYDWDISPFVKGRDSNPNIQTKALESLRSFPKVSAAQFAKGKAKFINAKKDIYAAVEDHFSGKFSDSQGKSAIIETLNSFFSWLEKVKM